MNIFNRDSKEKKFWSWLSEHKTELIAASPESQIFAELHKRLLSIHPLLVFDVEPQGDEGSVLTISCDGNEKGAIAVERLVSDAPVIEGLKIVAFRQPVDKNLTIELGEIKLSADDIYYEIVDSQGDIVNLKLFIKNINNNYDQYFQAAYILLNAAIGEYNSMKKIGSLEVEELPRETKGFHLLSKLKETL